MLSPGISAPTLIPASQRSFYPRLEYNCACRAEYTAISTNPAKTLEIPPKGLTLHKVFVSFDYENDRRYKYMLEAWNGKSEFEFTFQDMSSGEIRSNSVHRVKAALTAKINKATHTFVIVGRYANTPHRDRILIGSKNWINFEIKQSKANGNKLVAIKLDRSFTSPDELLSTRATWAMSFMQQSILRALRQA